MISSDRIVSIIDFHNELNLAYSSILDYCARCAGSFLLSLNFGFPSGVAQRCCSGCQICIR
ncbi:hypothetical protein BJY01DRAFT_220118 [Aspergillus pseudoustus]|uniref:Uncharacterized protein n=1 Tax=Aspergillus pseudoustus TaxID=1810923 RepID=A0ABR4JE46_9EURO